MAALSWASGDDSPAWALRAAFSAAESLAAVTAASAASTAWATADSVMAVGSDTRIESIGEERRPFAPRSAGGCHLPPLPRELLRRKVAIAAVLGHVLGEGGLVEADGCRR